MVFGSRSGGGGGGGSPSNLSVSGLVAPPLGNSNRKTIAVMG